MGRLFDSVAFLLDICRQNSHEAEAAVKLQAAAETRVGRPLRVERRPLPEGGFEWDAARLVRELCVRKGAGEDAAQLAADFHATVASMLAEAAVEQSARTGLSRVALSGGCFLNGVLLRDVREILRRSGLTVLEHTRVSCGDAGLALGQAMVAAQRMADIQPNGRNV
jgi:hydrogenase maturation protein HypF